MTLRKVDQELQYFQREVEYIQRMSELFAQQYPKVARRLELTSDHITDPHVARLVESFAYLSGKLNREIDDEFPRITTSLLSILYPQFTSPIPSMSMAHFSVDPQHGHSATTVSKIPRGTNLFTQALEKETVRFQTSYDLELWPIVIDDVEIVPSSAYAFTPDQAANVTPRFLKIRLVSLSQPFDQLGVKNLRFYIQGQMATRHTLLESLFRSKNTVVLANSTQDQPNILPQAQVNMVGFKPEESVLVQTQLAFEAYRLLQEFFVYPSKYFFFEVDQLDFSAVKGQTQVDLLISLEDKSLPSGFQVSKKNILYGCTPIVNLFKKTAEPISLNHRQSEYPLISDVRDQLNQEIHTILSVNTYNPETGDVSHYAPYFLFSDEDTLKGQDLFWVSRRKPSRNVNLPGTDVSLGFVTLNMTPTTPDVETVFVNTLCTNRMLATQLVGNTLLNIEDATSLGDVYCLDAPTMPMYPPMDAISGWKLITQMSLNQLSLSNSPESLKALKELLMIHTKLSGFEVSPYIDTILSMKTFPTVRRFGQEMWRGFVKGQGIELTVSDSYPDEYNPFLLTSVLQHFFRLYVDLNAYIQLSVKKRSMDETWIQWPALQGSVPIA